MFSAVPAAIRCQGLRKTYGSSDAATQALRGVDARIAAGELTILAGPSGCGKSTLLSIIAGLMDYDAGTCEVLGQEWKSSPTEQRESLRSRQLGFVFQAFNLLPALTALENVSVPLLIQGVTRRDAEARAQAALVDVGLAARARALPSALSGGQQQRVAIARALVHRPALLICDEPTSALDHSTGQEVMRLLRSAAVAPDRAVLVVTHDPRVHSFADRLLTMEDGRIVSDSTTPAWARE